MSAKKRKKGRRKKTRRKGRGAGVSSEQYQGGLMTRMVSGFRYGVGADQPPAKKGGWFSTLVTVAMLGAAVFLIVKRCT